MAEQTLVVFTLKATTHKSVACHRIETVPWELPFERLDLLDIFAYHNIVTAAFPKYKGAFTPPEQMPVLRVMQAVQDMTAEWSKVNRHPAYSRTGIDGYGPYWKLVETVEGEGHFFQWVVQTKRRVTTALHFFEVLSVFSEYLIFNEEVDREVERLCSGGACPVRSWNSMPSGGTARRGQVGRHRIAP